jgi:hypothetical protein
VALLFEAEPAGGELSAGDETTDGRYFTAAETECLEMGPFDRRRVADAFAGQEAAFVRDHWVF